MTDSDFIILEQWLNRGDGAFLSALELEQAMGSDEARRQLLNYLRANRERRSQH